MIWSLSADIETGLGRDPGMAIGPNGTGEIRPLNHVLLEAAVAAEVFEPKENKELIGQGGRILLELDEFALHAALSLYPDETEAHFNLDKILEYITRQNVHEGVDLEAVAKATELANKSGQPVERVIIAMGQAPDPGRDAFLEFPPLDRMPREEDDPADPVHFSARHIINIRSGEDVAIYHPLQEGIAGVSVRGKPIGVRQVVDKTARAGKNLEWRDYTVVSNVDGRLVIKEDKILVEETLEFERDLTLVYGDIDFIGGIHVARNIEAGVAVKCHRDLVVQGSIIGCDVQVDGNLIVEKGIVGSEETSILVRGSLSAAFIENARIHVEGRCEVKDRIATSLIRCSDAVEMLAGRGHFVSGVILARNGISLKCVGIPVGTKARLSVGRDANAEERMKELTADIERLDKSVKEIRAIDQKVGPMTRTYQKLSPEKQDEIEMLLEQLPRLEEELTTAREKTEELKPLLVPSHDAQVTVKGPVNPDAVIEFPLFRLKIPQQSSFVTFRFNERSCRIETVAAAA